MPTPSKGIRSAVKANLRTDYFDHWSPEMAYDLGYIAADGCVRGGKNTVLQLACLTDDEEIILGIRERLGSLHAVTRIAEQPERRGRFVRRPRTQVHIWSRELIEALARHGILPDKSHSDMPLPAVPDSFLPHFVRGYLDGDGCVTGPNKWGIYSLKLYGTTRLITDLQIAITRLVGVPKHKIHRHCCAAPIWYIAWSAFADLTSLASWLYPAGAYPFLARKKAVLDRAITG